MSRGDIKIVDAGGLSAVPTYSWQVASNASAPSIKAGEPVKQAGTNSQYVVICVDGDLTIGTDQPFIGIAASDSNETTSADGAVEVYMPLPGIVYEAFAKTAALANTTTLINALCGDALVMDLTTSKWTLDTAGGAGANNAFIVVGGNPTNSTLKFVVRQDATVIGRAQV